MRPQKDDFLALLNDFYRACMNEDIASAKTIHHTNPLVENYLYGIPVETIAGYQQDGHPIIETIQNPTPFNDLKTLFARLLRASAQRQPSPMTHSLSQQELMDQASQQQKNTATRVAVTSSEHSDQANQNNASIDITPFNRLKTILNTTTSQSQKTRAPKTEAFLNIWKQHPEVRQRYYENSPERPMYPVTTHDQIKLYRYVLQPNNVSRGQFPIQNIRNLHSNLSLRCFFMGEATPIVDSYKAPDEPHIITKQIDNQTLIENFLVAIRSRSGWIIEDFIQRETNKMKLMEAMQNITQHTQLSILSNTLNYSMNLYESMAPIFQQVLDINCIHAKKNIINKSLQKSRSQNYINRQQQKLEALDQLKMDIERNQHKHEKQFASESDEKSTTQPSQRNTVDSKECITSPALNTEARKRCPANTEDNPRDPKIRRTDPLASHTRLFKPQHKDMPLKKRPVYSKSTKKENESTQPFFKFL